MTAEGRSRSEVSESRRASRFDNLEVKTALDAAWAGSCRRWTKISPPRVAVLILTCRIVGSHSPLMQTCGIKSRPKWIN